MLREFICADQRADDLLHDLVAEQRLDSGIDVQNPRRVERFPHAGQKLWPQPVLALVGGQARQRPAQRVLADDLAHAKNPRTDPVATQRGDIRVAMVTSEDRKEPGTQNVPLLACVAAAVGQRATGHPGLVDPGGGQELGEKGELGVGRGAGLVIPANLDAAT